jgi:UDP-glucose 4-epimerase
MTDSSARPEGLCLVTGGGGFLGRHVVRRLLADGVRVRVLDRMAPPRGTEDGPPGPGAADWIIGDLGDPAARARALEGVSDVVHLACSSVPKTSEADPARDVAENVQGTVALLAECSARRIRRFVLSSSGGTVYGVARQLPIPETHPTEPLSAHGTMKLAQEMYAGLFRRARGLEVVILRVANAYGPGQDPTRPQGIVGVFLDRLRRDAPIRLEGGVEAIRDFVHVDDIAAAFALARRAPVRERVFNIGTGIGMRVRDILGRLEALTGLKARVEAAPANPFDVPANVLDAARAREQLGWNPAVSLEAGLSSLAAPGRTAGR